MLFLIDEVVLSNLYSNNYNKYEGQLYLAYENSKSSENRLGCNLKFGKFLRKILGR